LRARTERAAVPLLEAGVDVGVTEAVAVVGAGGAPEVGLASWALSLPEGYAAPLRLASPPVVGRVEKGRLLLDLRCVPADQDPAVVAAVLAVAGR
jgi:L-seryl-tRNA(Ser) seleniumtransferase